MGNHPIWGTPPLLPSLPLSTEIGRQNVDVGGHYAFCEEFALIFSTAPSSSLSDQQCINSVEAGCIVKGDAQNCPLLWRFSGALIFSSSSVL